MRRYSKTPIMGMGHNYGTSFAIPIIRNNIALGNIRFQDIILGEADRLDILAGIHYGDSGLWWIIAACSDVGWCVQIPAGTRIRLPNIADIEKILGG